ncbi:diphosphomevalonate decarboxylase [Candidatus Woesearchaeota archaeon]|nr:diphosphomevalonate decarboxylase [Candidatus Woesearchaeota archaeon]
MRATSTATPNIAIMKYWGKRNDALKLPLNDSISITLDSTFSSKTTVDFSEHYKEDSLVIDGVPASDKEMRNAMLVLYYLRKKAGLSCHARIESGNNFPKGAGIASSSSGYAALAVAAAAALNLKLRPDEISIAARLGSGSACRSVIGGFVQWKKGGKEDGSDSYSEQLADEHHWKEFRIVTAITSEEPKIIGSTEGMKRTVDTSKLYGKRLETLPDIIEQSKEAIKRKNHEELFRIAMAESNSLHAVMLDSWPPLIYLNETSRKIISKIHEFNAAKKETAAAYSFDAGPNCHIFTLAKHEAELIAAIKEISGVSRIHTSVVGKGPEVITQT